MHSPKNLSGSALVYSLVILSMLLAVALGVAAVSVIDQRNASSTGRSAQAFQVADAALEMVLKKSVDNGMLTLSETGYSCSDGVLTIDPVLGAGGKAKLYFTQEDGNDVLCVTKLNEIVSVKSVGEYRQTVRAIDAAMASGTLSWATLNDISSGWDTVSDFSNPQYAKDDRTGIVYLRGVIEKESGTAGHGDTIFDLPPGPGLCPMDKVELIVPCVAGTVYSCKINIYPCAGSDNLKVKLEDSIGVTRISLDGVSFPTN